MPEKYIITQHLILLGIHTHNRMLGSQNMYTSMLRDKISLTNAVTLIYPSIATYNIFVGCF